MVELLSLQLRIEGQEDEDQEFLELIEEILSEVDLNQLVAQKLPEKYKNKDFVVIVT